MEAFITKRELDHVLKELRRVQNFLEETFGSKFVDFKDKDSSVDFNHQFTATNAGKHLYSSSNTSEKNGKDLVSIIYPLEDQGDNDCVPIVTSTKSLQVPTNHVPRVPSIHNPSESVMVPILHSNKVSISLIPPVKTPQKITESETARNNKNEHRVKRAERLETLADTAAWLSAENVCNDPKHVPKTFLQPKSVKKVKGIVPATPGEFQLRGRTFYHKQPPPVPIINIDGGHDKVSSNDSVPIPIGIETMEGMPSPPKRPRPPPLPSFRNRTLGQQSTSTLKKPPTPTTSSSSTTASTNNSNKGRESEIIQCDLCNLFIYSSQLGSHMKNHSLLDGKSAEQSNRLLTKIQIICPICSIECVDYQMYEQHCAENHPEEGFPCPVCTRRMSSKPKLKRHMTIHRRLKFECKICGKAYNRKDNLTAHYKTHRESDEAVTVFYCPMCNMAFSSRMGRDNHVACGHGNKKHVSRDNSDGNPTEYDSSSSENDTNEGIVLPSRINIEGPIGFDFEYEGDDEDVKL